jgi:spore germination protein YaaH
MIHKNVATTAFLAAMLAFAPVSASLGAFALETEASWSDPDVDAARFHEIWGYLMTGEERYLDKTMPVSDVGYFGAGLSVKGKLVGVPDRARLGDYDGRVHLVVAEVSNKSVTHFCLDPEYPLRAALVADIIAAAEKYDGVQIDFELVLPEDAESFYSFLKDIKAGIGDKTFSVAIPARTRVVEDAYNYRKIAAIADRVIVMAYDEHWSGSSPGSIASLEWCRKVASFAMGEIGKAKLVMGLPFYGRAWGESNPSKAYRYSALSSLMAEKSIPEISRADEIPFFEYLETIKVRVFFEDAHSVLTRARMYQKASVKNISFWRLGQEDPQIWGSLSTAD